MRVFDFNSAIVRTPGKSVVNGLRATPGPAPVFETILAEHQAYIAALQAAGVQVTVLDALEQFPDSIFVEDPALVFSAGRDSAAARSAQPHGGSTGVGLHARGAIPASPAIDERIRRWWRHSRHA